MNRVNKTFTCADNIPIVWIIVLFQTDPLPRAVKTIFLGFLSRSRRPVDNSPEASNSPEAWNSRLAGGLTRFGDLLDHLDDAAAQFGVLDLHERFGQRQAVRGGQKVRNIGRRRRFAHAGTLAAALGAAFEEERDGNLQYVGNRLQPAGADAVGALFVFLHLLKSEPKPVAELLLAHAQHHPPHAHPRPHMSIGRVRNFFSHFWGTVWAVSKPPDEWIAPDCENFRSSSNTIDGCISKVHPRGR